MAFESFSRTHGFEEHTLSDIDGTTLQGSFLQSWNNCFRLRLHDYKEQTHVGTWCAWVGKDHSDHDLLITGDGRILRAKAIRQTGDLWDVKFLSSIEIGPEDLLKTYTHSTVRIPPGIPPAVFPIAEGVGTTDEAASDPHQIQAGEIDSKMHHFYHHHYDLQSWQIHLIHHQNSPMLFHRCHSLSLRLSWLVMMMTSLTSVLFGREGRESKDKEEKFEDPV